MMRARIAVVIPCLDEGITIAKVVRDAQRALPGAEGAHSELATLRDGWRILLLIGHLVREERPLAFFGSLFVLLLVLCLALDVPVVQEFLRTGPVPRLPTALLAAALGLLAFSSLACGLVLDTVTRGRKEMKRSRDLALPGPGAGIEAAQTKESAFEAAPTDWTR